MQEIKRLKRILFRSKTGGYSDSMVGENCISTDEGYSHFIYRKNGAWTCRATIEEGSDVRSTIIARLIQKQGLSDKPIIKIRCSCDSCFLGALQWIMKQGSSGEEDE